MCLKSLYSLSNMTLTNSVNMTSNKNIKHGYFWIIEVPSELIFEYVHIFVLNFQILI